MRKSLVFLLMIVMALSPLAASASDIADEVLPYAEHELSLPEGYSSPTAMAVSPDGAIVVCAKRSDGGWDLLTWRDLAAPPEAMPLSLEGGDVTGIGIAPDGQLMVTSMSLPTGEARNEAPVQQSPGAAPANGMGTANTTAGVMIGGMNLKTTVTWLSPDGGVVASFDLAGVPLSVEAMSDRRLCVAAMMEGVMVYDDAGTVITPVYANNALSVLAAEEGLYVVGPEEIGLYDLSTGQRVSAFAAQVGYSAKTCMGQDGALYLLNADGLLRFDLQSGQMARKMALAGTLLGDPGSTVSTLGMLADGTFVAYLSSGGMSSVGGRVAMRIGAPSADEAADSKLAYYTPLDPASVANRTPFTITAMDDSTRLRKAVSDFQRQHPELEVVLQVQRAAGDETPAADHIRTLNTDLLAGKGGDVLILDGLPLEKYAQRGILADLTELLPGFGLLPNIVQGSAGADGKIYAVPAQYVFDTLWGNAADLNAVHSLETMATAQLGAGKTPLTARTPEEWLRLFYPASEAAFRDENDRLHFNTPAFEAFLDALYSLYSTQGEIPEQQRLMMGSAQGQRASMLEVLAVYNGAAAFSPVTVSSLLTLSTAYSITGGEESAFIPFPALDGAGNTYKPSLLAGINARSRQQALAAEFLTLLFSPDVQGLEALEGLPTNAQALDKLFAEAVERSKASNLATRLMIPGGVELEISQPPEATWAALRTLCETVDIPVNIDETLIDFMVEETADFFEGFVSAKDAAQALEQRAWYYLNE